MIEVIKFGAEWCGPCRTLAPIIEDVKKKYNVEGSSINVIDIDIDENSEIAEKYSVKSIPTIIFLKDEEIKVKKIGVLSASQIDDIIKSL